VSHPPRARVYADAEALARGAAQELAQAAQEAIAAHGRFAVALSGGSTPRRMLERLAEPPLRERVDWSRTHLFWGDERSVPPEHPDSNYRMTKQALLVHVKIPERNVHRLEAERVDREAAARDYEKVLAAVCGGTPGGLPPVLDLILLGMGADGHTASLFPHTAALAEREHWVVSNHVPQLGTDRVTFSVPLINRGARVRFLAAGADKAERLHEVLEGPREPERLPSQLVAPEAGPAIWMLDRAAARKLERTPMETVS
jgi:6-phosphogluconolactonase